MTAKATKKEARARDAISRRKKALPQKEEARFVINRDGVLVHATVMFAQLLDQTRDQAEGKRFSHLVAFADPDSAFKGHNLFGPAAGAFVDVLHFHPRSEARTVRMDRDGELTATLWARYANTRFY